MLKTSRSEQQQQHHHHHNKPWQKQQPSRLNLAYKMSPSLHLLSKRKSRFRRSLGIRLEPSTRHHRFRQAQQQLQHWQNPLCVATAATLAIAPLRPKHPLSLQRHRPPQALPSRPGPVPGWSQRASQHPQQNWSGGLQGVWPYIGV